MLEWLVFALAWNVGWVIFYVAKPHLRRQMVWVSLFTALTGLVEPMFVPKYWNPPSLFNLSSTTHFDIESIVFSWGAGGIGSVLYEATLNLKHKKLAQIQAKRERRSLHLFSLIAMPLVFGLLFFFVGLNPIYAVSAGLLAGALAGVACRPDLVWNTLIGGLLFLALYFIMFLGMVTVFPDFINVWNLRALTGILVIGVPLEELMYAFTFGMMWSGVYEHLKYYSTNLK